MIGKLSRCAAIIVCITAGGLAEAAARNPAVSDVADAGMSIGAAPFPPLTTSIALRAAEGDGAPTQVATNLNAFQTLGGDASRAIYQIIHSLKAINATDRWRPSAALLPRSGGHGERSDRQDVVKPEGGGLPDEAVIPTPRPQLASAKNMNIRSTAASSVAALSDVVSVRADVYAAILSGLVFIGAVTSWWWFGARRLRRRVRDELVLFDAIARLSPADDMARGEMKCTLRQVETVFRLRAAAMVLVSTASWQVEDSYWVGAKRPPARILENAIKDIRARASGCQVVTLWGHPPSASGPHQGTRWHSGGRSPVITSLIWCGGDTGAMLIMRHPAGERALQANERTLRLIALLLGALIARRANIYPHTSPAHDRSGSPRELVGRVAHEFSNLLTSISGYAEMAADSLGPDSSPYRYVQHIRKAGDRAKAVIDDMLNQSRAEEHAKESFNATSAITEILPDVEMCMPPETRIHARLPSEPMLIVGNPLHLQQAVLNLCKNAGEAMEGSGAVKVNLSMVHPHATRMMSHGRLLAGKHVRVTVEDNGPGISDVDMQRIFDPYFTTKLHDGGTGLGLPIVCDAVRRLRGVMNVQTTIGEGTRFDLYFPFVASGFPQAAERGRVFDHAASATT